MYSLSHDRTSVLSVNVGSLLLLQVLSLAVLRTCCEPFLAAVTRVVGGLQREALREVSIDLVDEVSYERLEEDVWNLG